MRFFVNPFNLIGRGGPEMAAGVLFLVVYSVLFFLIPLSVRRILGFAAREKTKVIWRVVQKYSLPEHMEWQGRPM